MEEVALFLKVALIFSKETFEVVEENALEGGELLVKQGVIFKEKGKPQEEESLLG